MNKKECENLELKLLTIAIYEGYGLDFREYAMASFRRRIEFFIKKHNYTNITNLTSDIIHNSETLRLLIDSISVTTSEMFRDPEVFLYIRSKIIPYLKTFPHIRIWHAGCANGEEVYSLAILLKEEGLYDRCSIYATDINETALTNVKEGIFPIKKMKEYSSNYQKSGGKLSLSEYYHAKYDSVKFDKSLIQNVTFSTHNLATDSVFMETQFVLCRNAMIYFDENLQERVLSLFNESLINGGVLCIGNKESIGFSSIQDSFQPFHKDYKIYRKNINGEDNV